MRATTKSTKRAGEKLNLTLDPELRECIEQERARIESESGFRVSLTQIIEKAVRQALGKRV